MPGYDSAHYPEGHFVVVYSDQVLEHVVDIAAHLRELRRVLAPGGALLLGPLVDGHTVALVNRAGNEILLADRLTNAVTHVPIPSAPSPNPPIALAAHPDGQALLVLTEQGELYRVDLGSLGVVRMTTALCNAFTLTAAVAVAPDGSAIFTACGTQVSRIGVPTFVRTNVNVVGSGQLREMAITSDGATLYAVDLDTAGGNHHLIRLNASNLTSASLMVADAPSWLAIHPDNHTVYVTMANAGVGAGGAVRIFEGTTLALQASIFAIAKPDRVRFADLPSESQLWLNDLGSTAHPFTRSEYLRMRLVDIDADGRKDLCARGAAGVYCDRSSGSAFLRRAPAAGFADDFSDANGWNVASHYPSIRVVDVDGDGLPDVCGRGNEGVVCMRAVRRNGDVSYRPVEYRLRDFGDDRGWGASEGNWATVQPGSLDAASGVEFCGRAGVGISCSNL